MTDLDALARFMILRDKTGLRQEDLFTELVYLVPGDTLARIMVMAEHQRKEPGALLRRLVAEEWSRGGYSIKGEKR